MAQLKRTFIELVKNVEEVKKGGEPELEKVWTPHFLPWKDVREGMQILMEKEKSSKSDFEVIELMEEFIVNKVFGGSISLEDLQERLHAPSAMKKLQEVIEFVSTGKESDELRDFLEKKN